MVATKDDFFRQYPELEENPQVQSEIDDVLTFCSKFMEVLLLRNFEEPLEYTDPLNKVCRMMAYYELNPDKKQLYDVESETIEGYSVKYRARKLVYGIPEIDSILLRYMPTFRASLL